VLQDVLSIMKERGFVHIPIIDQDKHKLSVRHTEDEVNGVGAVANCVGIC
jgi:hypothetical protein